MNQPDPFLPLNCPTCGKPLRYISTTKTARAKTYLYVCPQDGLFELTGDRFGPPESPRT
jgi:hypothetical protein